MTSFLDGLQICLHAENTEQEVNGLVDALVEWAEEQIRKGSGVGGQERTLFISNAKL